MIRDWLMVSCATLLPPLSVAVAGVQYELVPISDRIGTGVSIVGTDLNNNGLISGIATSSFIDDLAFNPWLAEPRSGLIVELAPNAAAGAFLHAGPINDAGMVMGYYLTVKNQDGSAGGVILQSAGLPVPFGATSHAVIWSTDGSGAFTPIPGLGSILGLPEHGNMARGVNNKGQCVGVSRDGVDDPTGDRAFLYDESGMLHDLSGIGGPGTTAIIANDITDAGNICGVIRVDGQERAFIADMTGDTAVLPSLFNRAEGTEYMNAWVMNEVGQVAGTSVLVVETKGPIGPEFEVFERGFLWDATNGLQDLGEFLPQDLNDAGELTAIGLVPAPFGVIPHGFLRNTDGVWIDLNDLVSFPDCGGQNWISRAPAINNAGEILVIEEYCDQSVYVRHRTYVLDPHPACVGDLSPDQTVNVDDLFQLLGAWGPCVECLEDLTNDGSVTVDDLFLLISHWGACP